MSVTIPPIPQDEYLPIAQKYGLNRFFSQYGERYCDIWYSPLNHFSTSPKLFSDEFEIHGDTADADKYVMSADLVELYTFEEAAKYLVELEANYVKDKCL